MAYKHPKGASLEKRIMKEAKAESALFDLISEVTDKYDYFEDVTRADWEKVEKIILNYDKAPEKFVSITPDLLDKINADMEGAFKFIKDKYKVDIRIGNTRYSESEAKISIQVIATEKKKKVDASLAEMYGITLGMKVRIKGRIFTVSGFNERGRKNCIRIKEISSGKTFVTSATTVKNCAI